MYLHVPVYTIEYHERKVWTFRFLSGDETKRNEIG